MIAKVLKLELQAKKRDLWPVIKALKASGAVHLEPQERDKCLGLDQAETEERQALLSALEHIKHMESLAGNEFEGQILDLGSRDLLQQVSEIREELRELELKKDKAEEQARIIKDHQRVVAAAARLLHGSRDFVVITLAREELASLQIIKQWLKEHGLATDTAAADVAGNRVAVVIPCRELCQELQDFLWKEGFNQLELPADLRDLDPAQALEVLERQAQELPATVARLDSEIKRLLNSRKQRLSDLASTIRDRLSSLRIKAEFARKHAFTFSLHGWILKEEKQKLLEHLKDLSVAVKLTDPQLSEYHNVPVKLKNPGFIRPFQAVIGIYQLPMYGTHDPTWTLWFFFPIYFGFMLGDIGYGIIALVLFGFLRAVSKAKTMLRDFANLFLWCGVWTLVFGVAYGEFFGTLGESMGMKPLLMHRLHDIGPMLLVAIGFGVLQVLLGIFIGFTNNLRLKHYKHASYEMARLIGIAGILLAVIGITGILPRATLWTGLAMVGVSLPVVVWVDGLIAPLEMLSAIGNMMSFARLMAIGLASGILAMIANIFYSKIPLLIGGLIVALLFHALNTVLGIFDPTIQGLRLQLVEFFSKFYVTGTKEFKPLTTGGKDYVS